MKKLSQVLIVILKIALIIFLVVAFNLIMMPKYITENYDGRISAELYDEEVSPDIIFLGSSIVYSAVSPVALYEGYGYTSFDCASSSQSVAQSYYFLREVLKYYHPSMVIFDIGFLRYEAGYAEEVSNRKLYDYMKPSSLKFSAISATMAENESKWSYVFPVLRYHERYNDLSLDDFKYAFYKPRITYNGYIMNTNISEELPEPVRMEEAVDFRLCDGNREYLQKIMDLCGDNDITLMFMKVPSYQAKWGPEFEADIVDVAVENNIEYVNFDTYSGIMNINWVSDSPDAGGHLNLYGAEKFTYYLGNIIHDYYDVPNRKHDDLYREIWQKKVDRYEHDKEEKMKNSNLMTEK